MLLVFTFVGGMASAVIAIFAEYFLLDDKGIFPWLFGVTMAANPLFFFSIFSVMFYSSFLFLESIKLPITEKIHNIIIEIII